MISTSLFAKIKIYINDREKLSEEETLSLINETKIDDKYSTLAILKLVYSNVGLIISTISKYYSFLTTTFDYDDLLSVAIMSFIRAIQLFNEKKGNKFSTYAVSSMNLQIRRALDTIAPQIRIPVLKRRELFVIKQILQRYYQESEEIDKLDYVKKYSGFSKEKINYLLSIPEYVKSLNDPITENSPEEYIDFIPTYKNHIREKEYQIDREIFINFLKRTLTDQEVLIILKYYGFMKEGFEKVTFTEIAEEMNVSRELIRQKHNEAIKKLKKNTNNILSETGFIKRKMQGTTFHPSDDEAKEILGLIKKKNKYLLMSLLQ